ncbi:MAG: DJ-1 family glyoxalase III [Clostridia bacterium]
MIYVFLADGFEEIEALATVDILRRAELSVKVVGVGAKVIEGAHQIPVTCDITTSEITTDDIEMVVLPGGIPGTLNLEKDPIVKACITYAFHNDLFVGAICAAPSILGHMNLISGKNVTCYPGFDTQLNGANYTCENVTVDGKLITGKGAGVADDFALTLVEHFHSKARADKIKASMFCK